MIDCLWESEAQWRERREVLFSQELLELFAVRVNGLRGSRSSCERRAFLFAQAVGGWQG